MPDTHEAQHLSRGRYARLAHAEEREAEARFGEQWREYAARTPMFIPQRTQGVS